jgi:hypothetical protein
MFISSFMKVVNLVITLKGSTLTDMVLSGIYLIDFQKGKWLKKRAYEDRKRKKNTRCLSYRLMVFVNQGRWKLREGVHHVWKTYELCTRMSVNLKGGDVSGNVDCESSGLGVSPEVDCCESGNEPPIPSEADNLLTSYAAIHRVSCNLLIM